MCHKCDELNSSPAKLSDEELLDHHVDVISELAFLARDISESQIRIHMLSKRADEIEVELELREAKTGGLN